MISSFSSTDLDQWSANESIDIRIAPVPQDSDNNRVVKEALSLLNIDDFVPEDDVSKFLRNGNKDEKLG